MTFLASFLLGAGIIPAVGDAPACLPIDSESVAARDIAPLAPGFERLPGDFLIGFVESSGAPRMFHSADLERIAKNRGVELQGLNDVCVQRRTFVPTAGQIADQIRASLGRADAKIEISASSQQPVPTGEVVFPRSGVQATSGPEVMWRGYVQARSQAKYPVWARVRITVPVQRIVAASNLTVGKPIQSSEITAEAVEASPFEDGFLDSVSQASGMLPRVAIPKGSAIRRAQVAAPMDVSRGDTVRVEVYAGNAHLSLEARAETAGMKGAVITVRNLGSGTAFQATVEGKDQARVGGQAE